MGGSQSGSSTDIRTRTASYSSGWFIQVGLSPIHFGSWMLAAADDYFWRKLLRICSLLMLNMQFICYFLMGNFVVRRGMFFGEQRTVELGERKAMGRKDDGTVADSFGWLLNLEIAIFSMTTQRKLRTFLERNIKLDLFSNSTHYLDF